MRLLAVLLLTAACGGSATPTSTTPTTQTTTGSDAVSDPIPHTAGPDCTVVAERLAIAAAPDSADEQAKIRGDATTRCRDDRWSDDARSCFAAVENEQEFEGCVGKLTPAQKAKLPGRSDEAPLADEESASGGAAKTPATTAPPPPTKASTKKPGGTRSADPEEGGE